MAKEETSSPKSIEQKKVILVPASNLEWDVHIAIFKELLIISTTI